MSAEFNNQDPNSSVYSFADGLTAVYGEIGAHEIATSLMCSIDDALVNVPLLRQPDLTFDINFGQDPYYDKATGTLGAYADSANETITLVMSTTASSGEIANALYNVIHHEVGHIAHYQHSKDRGAFVGSPFGAACAEGIADLAAGEDFGTAMYRRGFSASEALEVAREELDKTLSGFYEGVDDYDFLYGDEELLHRGYFIGAYVISSLVLYEGIELIEVMQSPLMRFKKFAKAELL